MPQLIGILSLPFAQISTDPLSWAIRTITIIIFIHGPCFRIDFLTWVSKFYPVAVNMKIEKNRYLNLRCPQVEGLQTLICFALPYADDWKKKVAN